VGAAGFASRNAENGAAPFFEKLLSAQRLGDEGATAGNAVADALGVKEVPARELPNKGENGKIFRETELARPITLPIQSYPA
jgi:hypothetical protein